ncbi:er membrane protein complex subunit 7 [Anaeramoeba ignava]|uniref:Er membrane protein complex subunit 7 n=1 Tax=Anaeramoeba ignava TaxID=1746090 RepID=A0A9Q0LV36_ANAIG|nr:er membrane protein complex subunit 7 [Anaeramoeba ignava]
MNFLSFLFFTFLFIFITSSKSDSLNNFEIEGKVIIPGTSRIPQFKIILNGGKYVSFTALNGKFNFHGLQKGVYYLEVVSSDYIFSPVVIDVHMRKEGEIRIQTADETNKKLKYPLKLIPLKQVYFSVQKPPFQFANLLKNPMILMLGSSLIFMFIVPKMMKNIDPNDLPQLNQRDDKGNPVGLLSQMSQLLNQQMEKSQPMKKSTAKKNKKKQK